MESDSDVESYQRGGRVMKGRKRGLRPAKKAKSNVQIVTVNVTRPQARSRGNAPRQVPATVQSFVQQPTMIRQPYSLASASGPYQSYREEAEQQRLGEYFKSISSEPDKAQSFNELPRRVPTMVEFSSQTDPIQLSRDEIAKKRLERFKPKRYDEFSSQTDPIRFSDFSSQTDPNKFSNFGTQTDINKDINFAEMEKARKKLKPVEEPVEEPVEPPVEEPVEEEKKEEGPALYLKSAVLYDIKSIQNLKSGSGVKGVKDTINAILSKYNIVIRGKDIPAMKEKAIQRLLALEVVDASKLDL